MHVWDQRVSACAGRCEADGFSLPESSLPAGVREESGSPQAQVIKGPGNPVPALGLDPEAGWRVSAERWPGSGGLPCPGLC